MLIISSTIVVHPLPQLTMLSHLADRSVISIPFVRAGAKVVLVEIVDSVFPRVNVGVTRRGVSREQRKPIERFQLCK